MRYMILPKDLLLYITKFFIYFTICIQCLLKKIFNNNVYYFFKLHKIIL